MPKPRSINQNILPDALPNFRNLGVVLRIVLMVNGIALFVAITQAESFQDIWQRLAHDSAFLQPVLLASLLILHAINNTLARIRYQQGMIAVSLSVALITWIIAQLGGDLFTPSAQHETFNLWRQITLSVIITALLLAYFRLRSQSLSPALPEARLQALQARIRPHFLFNSINAVLAIVRSDPKRAESALEDMADLFRMAMADNRQLAPINREVELSKQYLAIEKLRLGERLKVDWQTQNMPPDALIPPLILQPLLENAVYHGIEPLQNGGKITVKLYRSSKEMHLDVYNPRQPDSKKHDGNKMALSNIRERLALQFDVEANYSVETGTDFYHVHILIPYVREESR